MKVIRLDRKRGQFFIGHFDTGFIGVFVKPRLYLEALPCRSASDQVHHHLAADQRAASPVGRDVAKNAGTADGGSLPKGSFQAVTDFGKKGYGGPCPPVGDHPHHYIFTLYALKTANRDSRESVSCPYRLLYPSNNDQEGNACRVLREAQKTLGIL